MLFVKKLIKVREFAKAVAEEYKSFGSTASEDFTVLKDPILVHWVNLAVISFIGGQSRPAFGAAGVIGEFFAALRQASSL